MGDKFLRYSSMAFEIMVSIGIGAFSGQWLDKKMHYSMPVFTAALSLFGVFIGLYIALRDFIGKK